jgi:hypothetical protein
MRTLVVLVVGLALAAGCGEDDEQPAAAPYAELLVTVDMDGQGGAAPRRAEVACETAESGPCADLNADVFEPTPRGTACTQLFGGRQTATVTGTFGGERIDARFSRNNGCEIARWKQAASLLER